MEHGTTGQDGSGVVGDASDGASGIGGVGNADGGGDDVSASIGGLPVASPESGEVVKRGRGRPRKDAGSGASGGSGSPARASAGKTKGAPPDAVGIESLLFVIHAGLAGATKTPEFALDKDEAKELGQAVANVNAHYGKVLDPKTVAWVALVMVAGKVYGPRVGAWKLRTDMERADRGTQARRAPLRPVPSPTPPQPQPSTGAPAQPFTPMPFNPAINPLN